MNCFTNIIGRIGNAVRGVVDFYVQGFRDMTLGRTLWAMIIIKLIILFAVFKLLFFPDLLSRDYDDDPARAQAVRSSLVGR